MMLIAATLTLALQGATPDFQSYRAHIEAATAALSRGNSRLAKQWLAEAPKQHRGWEWDYLTAQCDSSVASFQASDKSITKVQVSPDGTTLATASADGLVSLWDTKTLALKGKLEGHTNSVFGLNFSGDGRHIVTTSRDNSIRLWDARTAKPIGVLGEHPVTPYNAAFTPDGKRVVSVGWRMHPESKSPVGLIRVWDVETKKMVHDMDYTTHPLSSLTFSKDGSHCYIGCWEYQVAELNMASYKIEREITPEVSPAYKAVDWVEITPDGKHLVTACKDKTAKYFDIATGREVFSLAHGGHVTSARPTGSTWLVTSSQDGAVRIWDATTQKLTATLLGHDQPINCLAMTPDGARVFSADVTGKVMVWDTREPRAFSTTYELNGAWSCVFSPDGTKIAVGTNLKTLQVRDARTGALLGSTPEFGALVVDAAWSPDGKRLAAGSNDGSLRCFDGRTLTQLWIAQGKGQIRATDWSSDGKFIAGGDGSTGIATVWDAATGQPVFEHKMDSGTINVAFSPDAKRVAFASMKTLEIHEVPSGKLVRQVKTLSSDAVEVAFSPDGKSVAAGGTSGHVELFDATSLDRKWSSKTDGSQWGVHFSPDGKRLASIGYDFTAHLWDPKTGLEVFAIRDLPVQGFDIRFSPDGHRLAYMGGSGETWILDRRPFKLRNNP